MNLVRWNPFREMDSFHDRMNRFFGEGFFPSEKMVSEWNLADWKPAVDVYEEDNAIVIKAELPGIDKKDIEVELNDGVLTLKGERNYENEVKEDNYYRKERAYGKFHRAFTLPEGLDPEKVEAAFKDGVLKVTVPKPEEKQSRKISVH
jgi:HSP20 family protein